MCAADVDCDFDASLFELADESCRTVPTPAGELKIGHFVVVRKRACRIIDLVRVKVGKHGATKTVCETVDVFNGRRGNFSAPSSAVLPCPVVSKSELILMDIDEDHLSLLDENNAERTDLDLPSNDEELRARILAHFAAGHQLSIIVLSAMGESQVCAVKIEGR